MNLTFDQIKHGMRIHVETDAGSYDHIVSRVFAGKIYDEDGKYCLHQDHMESGFATVTSEDAPLITYNVGREDLQDILGPDADVDAWVAENGKHFTNRLDEMLRDLVRDLTWVGCDE